MASFLSDLTLLWNLVVDCLGSMFNLYTTAYILIAVFGIWVVRRVFRLFEYLVH